MGRRGERGLSVDLRAATGADLPALARLESSAMAADAWSPAALAAELDEVPATRWVVVAHGQAQCQTHCHDPCDERPDERPDDRTDDRTDLGIVGYAAMLTVGDTADVHRVVVAEAVRCGGIGRLLVEALLVEAARRGCTEALLEVAETNVGARALYAAAGFVQVARRGGYYRDGVAALVLRAEVPGRGAEGGQLPAATP